ncbi:lysoplasmalogenase TMEM86A-like [Euwallacea fornicatus]|uniref:lysoplasmalogenase TMEM86A-like n=1 Tax=Euwallacea fornicatus TaxID=995702 RepID=UPI00339070FA
MNSIVKQEKAVAKDLAPFFVCWLLYCILPVDNPSLWIVITKCSPIVALMHFVLYNGCPKSYKYSCRILIGLIFCAIGDAFLVSEDYFIPGLLAFTGGHLSYIMAFGFRPVKLMLYPVIGSMATMIGSTLVRKLTGLLVVVVPLYIFIISIMIWRAGARIQRDGWSWLQFITLIGSILFAISDTILGINRFIFAIPDAQIIIMTSYYIAQLCITLSVLEGEVRRPHWQSKPVNENKDEKKKRSEIQQSKYESQERQESERERQESEQERQESEQERQESEQERQESEQERQESEEEKQESEQERQESEHERQERENERQESEKVKRRERTVKKQKENEREKDRRRR